MRRALRDTVLRLLGSRGLTLLSADTMRLVIDKLAARRVAPLPPAPELDEISRLRTHLRYLLSSTTEPDAPLAAAMPSVGSAAPDNGRREAAVDQWLREIPKRLDRVGAECLSRAEGDSVRADALRGLSAHYAASASLVSRFWIGAREWGRDPFPDDDNSLRFVVERGIWVPGNEVEVGAERKPVPWRSLFEDPDAGIFLVLGQSNAGNHGSVGHASVRDVYSFDFMRVESYRASDPLPGASGDGGSIWTRLGDRLIAEGVYRRVLFVPVAFGGTYIADWAPGGSMHPRLQLALARLRNALASRVLGFSGVLWQQGEADANHTDMLAETYQAYFHHIVADLRENGVFAPVFVARSTLCEAGAHPNQNHQAIRDAQAGLVNPAGGILLGPDTDTVGAEDRSDGCHLSERGLQRCADLWFDVIAANRPLLMKI